MQLRTFLAMVGIGTACAAKPDTSGESADSAVLPGTPDGLLLVHDQWTYVLPASDPFYTHEPDADPCPSVGYKAESGFFELETDYCAVASFSQPVPFDVPAGARLRMVVWNLDLWAPDPGYEALQFLRLGDTELWSQTTAVPGNESVSELFLDVPVDVPAGTLAWYHLQNHGVNSWRIGDVELVP